MPELNISISDYELSENGPFPAMATKFIAVVFGDGDYSVTLYTRVGGNTTPADVMAGILTDLDEDDDEAYEFQERFTSPSEVYELNKEHFEYTNGRLTELILVNPETEDQLLIDPIELGQSIRGIYVTHIRNDE